MFGFFFKRKQNHTVKTQPVAQAKSGKFALDKIQAEELAFDDSELGVNVRFDEVPMTREQMRSFELVF